MAHPETEKDLRLAMEHLQAGRLVDAEKLYRKILAREPRHPIALHLSGLVAHRMGRHREAIELIQNAVAVAPKWPEAFFNLGIVFKDDGQIDAAIRATQQAILLKPNYPEALGNLGNLLLTKGQHGAAIAAFCRVTELQPRWHEGHNNLGVALRDGRQIDQAIAAFTAAVTLHPGYPEAHNNLGNALRDKGQLHESVAAYQKAMSLRPHFPEAANNLGTVLKEMGRFTESVDAFRVALRLRPGFVEAWNNLGVSLDQCGELDAAIAAFQKATVIKPDYAEAWHNLGNAFKDQAQLDQSIAAYRTAITLHPDFREAHNNLVYLVHFHPAYDAAGIAAELQRWKAQHADPIKLGVHNEVSIKRGADPERLRIGYVSPDFCEHPVGRFLLPLLANHDRDQFEIFAYSHIRHPDAMTETLRPCTDHWRDISALSDDQAAEMIRQDRIDILIDLTMHMARNRLLLFARRCAPVQATYLAYCSTTGLDTIDFRLSDPYLDPPDTDHSLYSEKTIRLRETYWCYQPVDAAAEPDSLPARQNGFITFGCLNNFCKVSRPVIEAWIQLLSAVPNSQLLLSARSGSHRDRLREESSKHGIDPARVRFADKLPMREYFQLYHEIDIAMDTFPYGGGTTTCDALWMGVPVISLAGHTAVGRGGASILTNIGLPDLVAHTTEDYVKIAADLASDLPRLDELRRTLRDRMAQSPLMDAPRFARQVEDAYRQMWREADH